MNEVDSRQVGLGQPPSVRRERHGAGSIKLNQLQQQCIGPGIPDAQTSVPVSTGRLTRKIPISRTTDTAASPLDTKRFLISTSDSELEVHDLETGRVLARLRGHGSAPLSVAVSPDGKLFASADWDGRLRIWDARSYALLLDLAQFDGAGPMAFSADGRTLAKADLTRVHFVHLATGRTAGTLPFQITPNDTLAISPDDRSLALIDRSGHLRLWHAPRR